MSICYGNSIPWGWTAQWQAESQGSDSACPLAYRTHLFVTGLSPFTSCFFPSNSSSWQKHSARAPLFLGVTDPVIAHGGAKAARQVIARTSHAAGRAIGSRFHVVVVAAIDGCTRIALVGKARHEGV